MARTIDTTASDSSLHYILGDPHLKLWTNLYDLIRGTYYCSPLFILLAVVLRSLYEAL